MGKTTCILHGTVLARCRCADPKHDRTLPCPGPPKCIPREQDAPVAPALYDWAKEHEL